jgi:hypothetical protein
VAGRAAAASLSAALFVVVVLGSGSLFWPRFDEIDHFDNATYVNGGRVLIDHARLPVLAQGPLLAVLYGALYRVVRAWPSWFVLVVGLGRILLGALVWAGAVSLASTLGGSMATAVTVAFLILSPVVGGLVQNPSDALFAGLSALALQQTLASADGRSLRPLATASTLVALAALTRTDGLVLFPLFLALALPGAGGWRRRGLAAACPFVLIVGGYLALRVVTTGGVDDVASLRWRSYMAFEQGQGVVFAERYPAGTSPYVEGHVQARRLYGTPEENRLSLPRAIGRNWPAFRERVSAAARQVPAQVRLAYGGWTGVILVLWLVGALALVADRSPGPRTWAPLGWPLHLAVYLLTFFRAGYFLLPFAAVLAVASLGAKRLLRALPWTPRAGVGAAALLILAGSVLGVFLAGLRPVSFDTAFGRTPSERSILFLQNQVPHDARIAAYAPAPVWAAKREYVSLILTLRDFRAVAELRERLDRERVSALYVEDSLRELEPGLWTLIESLIGTSLTVVFADGPIRILAPRPVQRHPD